MSKAGQKILAALKEFGDALDSGVPLEERFTVRTYVIDAEPGEFDGPAVRALRDSYGMSQGVFAGFLCVSPGTVQAWEQGRRPPSPLARRFMGELAAGRAHFRSRLADLAKVRTDARNSAGPAVPINPQVAPVAPRPAQRVAAEQDRATPSPRPLAPGKASAKPAKKKTTVGA